METYLRIGCEKEVEKRSILRWDMYRKVKQQDGLREGETVLSPEGKQVTPLQKVTEMEEIH